MENIIMFVAQGLQIICDIIILMLPWMILAAINAVKKSVDEASARRSYEAQKIISALQTLHGDLFALANGEDTAKE